MNVLIIVVVLYLIITMRRQKKPFIETAGISSLKKTEAIIDG